MSCRLSHLLSILSYIISGMPYIICHTSYIIPLSYKFSIVMQVIRLPLKLKYACPAQSTWKLAVDSLLKIIHKGLTVSLNAENSGEEAVNFIKFIRVCFSSKSI